MEKPKDYYQLLGVPRDASLTAIRRAFRRLTRRHSPLHEPADAQLAELQAAFETLSDADRRRRYDDELRGERPLPVEWSNLRRPAAGDLRRPFTPASLAAEVVLEASQAERGTLLSLDIPVTAVCRSCDGTGGQLLSCEYCQGEGKVRRRLPVPIQVPPRSREGAVFEVRTDDPATPSLLLTVHVRRRL
jgi:DnaJ-class molecular chaperone